MSLVSDSGDKTVLFVVWQLAGQAVHVFGKCQQALVDYSCTEFECHCYISLRLVVSNYKII